MEGPGSQKPPCDIVHPRRNGLSVKLLRNYGLSVTAVSIVLRDLRLGSTLSDTFAGTVRS